LVRSLIANMVTGVTEGYRKDLVINGVGFRAALNGRTLSMSLGFASPVEYTVPETVTVAVNNNTEITVSGIDKQQVGNVAARIRSYYPAEPYKGKGVQYKGERIRRKEGKTVA
jgi:large subunit ribosomal protein L6